MKVLWNDDQDDLWCVECKTRIHLGEKFIEIKDEYGDVKKCYHPECLPEMEDEE